MTLGEKRMMFAKTLRYVVFILPFCLSIQAAHAQSGGTSMSEFQQSMFAYVEVVEATEIATRLEALNLEEWQALYDAFGPYKETFAKAVSFMEEQAAANTVQQQSPSLEAESITADLALVPGGEFDPRYPEGATYDVFVATLPGLGLLPDTDLPGTNDDRCDASGEAGARIALGVLEFAAIVAQVACDTIVVILGEGTNLPACVIQGIADAAVVANEIVLSQCGYQTALVDSAEIEAAYENTRRIIENQLEIVEMKRIHMQVVGIPAQGCSQGFWKNRTEFWDSASGMDIVPNFDPGTMFDDVFGPDSDTGAGLRNNADLLDAVSAKGNGSISQVRNAVTLLLNSDALNNGFALPCSPTIIGDIGSLVLPIQIRRHFLLSTDEAGVPTDVAVDTVNAAILSTMGTIFTDVTAMTTSTPVEIGTQELEIVIPPDLSNSNVFQFLGKHDHGTTTLGGTPIEHFGTILVHLDHGSNLGMGQ